MTAPDTGEPYLHVSSATAPPAWIDSAWWDYPELPWIEHLARKWQLVRRPDALSPLELRAQGQRTAYLLGLEFLLAEPLYRAEYLPGPPAGFTFTWFR